MRSSKLGQRRGNLGRDGQELFGRGLVRIGTFVLFGLGLGALLALLCCLLGLLGRWSRRLQRGSGRESDRQPRQTARVEPEHRGALVDRQFAVGRVASGRGIAHRQQPRALVHHAAQHCHRLLLACGQPRFTRGRQQRKLGHLGANGVLGVVRGLGVYLANVHGLLLLVAAVLVLVVACCVGVQASALGRGSCVANHGSSRGGSSSDRRFLESFGALRGHLCNFSAVENFIAGRVLKEGLTAHAHRVRPVRFDRQFSIPGSPPGTLQRRTASSCSRARARGFISFLPNLGPAECNPPLRPLKPRGTIGVLAPISHRVDQCDQKRLCRCQRIRVPHCRPGVHCSVENDPQAPRPRHRDCNRGRPVSRARTWRAGYAQR